MALKTSTVALISTAVIASFGIGYLVYYDQKRRNDPNYKKQLKRERKKAAKQTQEKQKKEIETVGELVQHVLDAVAKEVFPESPEEKEAYFLERVAAGEQLVQLGEDHYAASVEYFYKALKIYPAPLELIMIYQKTLPEKVFRIVVNIMALEQQQRQAQFYTEFPPAEYGLKLKELATEKSDEKELRGLVADKDFEEGQVLYTESPLISSLYPTFEGTHCNNCMKKLVEKIECKNCDQVGFCSSECETEANTKHHQFLCTNNKVSAEAKTTEFLNFTHDSNQIYPQMIARFLSSMVSEEMEKNKLGKDAPKYGAWDHIERMKQLTIESPTTQEEIVMIRDVLMSKVPGIDEFLSGEIYGVLKSKLNANCYQIPSTEEVETLEQVEPVLITDSQRPGLGDALYKISSYIGKADSEEEANVQVSFDNYNIVVKATKVIKQGDEIKTFYH